MMLSPPQPRPRSWTAVSRGQEQARRMQRFADFSSLLNAVHTSFNDRQPTVSAESLEQKVFESETTGAEDSRLTQDLWSILDDDLIEYKEGQPRRQRREEDRAARNTSPVTVQRYTDIKRQSTHKESLTTLPIQSKENQHVCACLQFAKDNDIEPSGVLANPSLLNLSSRCLTLSGRMVSMFPTVKRNLRELYITNTILSGQQILDIASYVKGSTVLSLLCLQDTNLGATDAEVVAEAMLDNSSLTAALLDDNNIQCDGACAMAESLKAKMQLTSLTLSYNGIADRGAAALADALSHAHPTSDSDTDDTDAEAKLGKHIAHHFPELQLAGNLISDAGAKRVAELCLQNPTLKYIDLRDNEIGSVGAKALAQMIQRALVSETLDLQLDDNKISDKGIAELLQASSVRCKAQRGWGMHSISIGGNDIGPRSMEFLLSTC